MVVHKSALASKSPEFWFEEPAVMVVPKSRPAFKAPEFWELSSPGLEHTPGNQPANMVVYKSTVASKAPKLWYRKPAVMVVPKSGPVFKAQELWELSSPNLEDTPGDQSDAKLGKQWLQDALLDPRRAEKYQKAEVITETKLAAIRETIATALSQQEDGSNETSRILGNAIVLQILMEKTDPQHCRQYKVSLMTTAAPVTSGKLIACPQNSIASMTVQGR